MYHLASKYTCVQKKRKGITISSEDVSQDINSEVFADVLLQIAKQPTSEDQLLENCQSFFEQLERRHVLSELEREGIIFKEQPKIHGDFWACLGYNSEKLGLILNDAAVNVLNFDNSQDSVQLEKALTDAGVQLSNSADLTICLVDDYLDPRLTQLNKDFLVSKHNWMLVNISSFRPIIGPFFVPEESACLACLQQRLRMNNALSRFSKEYTYRALDQQKPRTSPISLNMAISKVVLTVVDTLYHRFNGKYRDKLITMDLAEGKEELHSIVKRPQCKTCGNQETAPSLLDSFQQGSQQTTATKEGGYRSVTAEETLGKYVHHVSNMTGVVRLLEPYASPCPDFIFNYKSGRNIAYQSTSEFWNQQHLRSGSGGKGKTVNQAKVGALCEAIERYSLTYHEQKPITRSSHEAMTDGVHPNDCMLFSQEQYESRIEINKKASKFHALIPVYLETTDEVDWTEVYSVSEKRVKYLPSAYCYAQYPAKDENNLLSYPDSNGCASGNTLEEAMLQGLLELIERDAAAIWWYNRIQRPGIDLDLVENEYLNKVRVYYETIGRKLEVLDITTDMGVPVFVAISYYENREEEHILYAFGAHVEAEIAFERAVIELNQLLPIALLDSGLKVSDKAFGNWLTNAKIKDHPYLTHADQPRKNLSLDYSKYCEPTISDALNYLLNKLEELDLECLALDLTQPDVGLPVVKVMVPGLRHFWRRTAPGRLYDVPVKMGWVTEVLNENELNPESIYI